MVNFETGRYPNERAHDVRILADDERVQLREHQVHVLYAADRFLDVLHLQINFISEYYFKHLIRFYNQSRLCNRGKERNSIFQPANRFIKKF